MQSQSTRMSPSQPVCAGVLGLVGSTRSLLTSMVLTADGVDDEEGERVMVGKATRQRESPACGGQGQSLVFRDQPSARSSASSAKSSSSSSDSFSSSLASSSARLASVSSSFSIELSLDMSSCSFSLSIAD